MRWPATATAHTSKFVGIQFKKKTFERRRCIPNMCFVREEAHFSAYWLIWRLRVSSEKKLILARIGLFGDYEGRDFTVYLKYRAQLGVRFRPSGS